MKPEVTASGVISSFTPDLNAVLPAQKITSTLAFNAEDRNVLDGAGVVTLVQVGDDANLSVLTAGKKNPESGAFEQALGIGGGFGFLPEKGAKSTFKDTLDASIKFKAKGLPLFNEPGDPRILNHKTALLQSFRGQYGMERATLFRVIKVRSLDEARELVNGINSQMNPDSDLAKNSFGLYHFNDVLRSAELTYQLADDNKLKKDALKSNQITVTNTLTKEKIDNFVVFDDAVTGVLSKNRAEILPSLKFDDKAIKEFEASQQSSSRKMGVL